MAGDRLFATLLCVYDITNLLHLIKGLFKEIIMGYQETGRFGRITKSLRKNGFCDEMDDILFDSDNFTKLKKTAQTEYVEIVVNRMEQLIGEDNTKKVLFECGKNCCGKSWSNFAKRIYNNSNSIEDFVKKLNEEEIKYSTIISYDKNKRAIQVRKNKMYLWINK